MIERITAQARFPDSDAVITSTIQPQLGITAVVGKNGTGKTFLGIEAARWLLFGKAALRGAASDYKDSEVEGKLQLRGQWFTIHRGKKDWIKDATGGVVAVGSEKTTEKVVEQLGYGMDVFDLCNAALQGQVQRLGDIRPSERKQLIDRVLRLTDAESAEKACREEAAGFRREAEALVKQLVPIGDAPQPPKRYRPTSVIKNWLETERAAARAYQAVKDRMHPVGAPPVQPVVDAFDDEEIEKLQKHQSERSLIELQRASLEEEIYGDAYSQAELDAAEARLAYVERGPKPVISLEEAEQQLSTWQEIAVLHKLNREQVECPKCSHKFLTGREPPPEPLRSSAELRAQIEAHRRWEGHLDDEEPQGLDLPRSEIREGRRQLELRAKLAALPPTPEDHGVRLAKMQADRAAVNHWATEKTRYEAILEENARLEQELEKLSKPLSDVEIDELHRAWREAEQYERDCQLYDERLAAFNELTAKIEEASRLAAEFKAGAEGLADARATVKALIAPRISRIASQLINDMTMGKLKTLTVDENMEITVGRQRIETLSGAGKTVANIALRVAMGLALVSQAFPVFLADEIDGDLDEERREATLMAIAGLRKHLKQIILVTHRSIEVADHVHVTG